MALTDLGRSLGRPQPPSLHLLHQRDRTKAASGSSRRARGGTLSCVNRDHPTARPDGGGETDLGRLVASLQPEVRPGEFVFVCLASPSPEMALATVHEDEGITHVVPREVADTNGWGYDFVAAWITLRVHSSLAAVGLTAVVSRALADAGISCNVLAGHHHDHLLVPVDRATDTLRVLRQLSASRETL